MKISKLFALAIGIVSLFGFSALFSDTANSSILLWPLEAFLGLAFTLGFGLGLPTWLAYLGTALIFLAVFAISYYLVTCIFKKFHRKSDTKTKSEPTISDL